MKILHKKGNAQEDNPKGLLIQKALLSRGAGHGDQTHMEMAEWIQCAKTPEILPAFNLIGEM